MCDCLAQFIWGILEGCNGVIFGLIDLEEVVALLFDGFGAGLLLCCEGLHAFAVDVSHFGIN